MGKASLENGIRNDILTAISDLLGKKYDTDVLVTGSNEICIPCLDSEGNEKYAVIKVSIPRGERSGGTYKPYNGYSVAEDYAADVQERTAKAEARAEKKAHEEAERARKREMRTVKVKETEMKKKLAEVAKLGKEG